MRIPTTLLLLGSLLAVVPSASAQRANRGTTTKSSGSTTLVNRMMQFDADKDGKLTKGEITDDRLLGLFDRADANQDGTLTKKELTTFAAKDRSNAQYGRGGPFGGPGGLGGMGGPGGPRPKPGEVLPERLQQRLKLTVDQKIQLKELQKEVDSKLAKILTSEQKSQLEEMATRGPGGLGGPGGGPGDGPGGFGGPGGGPGGDGFDRENSQFPGPQF